MRPPLSPLTPAAAAAAADLAARALLAAVLRSAAAARRLAALVLARGAPAVAAWLVSRMSALLAAVRASVAVALARGGGLAGRAAWLVPAGTALPRMRLAAPPALRRAARMSLAWAERAVSLAPRLEFGGRWSAGGGGGDLEAGPSSSSSSSAPTQPPPPPRHALTLVFAGGLLAVEVSVPRVRHHRLPVAPPPPVPPAAAEGGPAPEVPLAPVATPPPQPHTHRPPVAVRSSADALRHLASFAALTTENARSPTPGAATSPPLRQPQALAPHLPPSSPLRESTASINCPGGAVTDGPETGKGPAVLTAVAVSPRMG